MIRRFLPLFCFLLFIALGIGAVSYDREGRSIAQPPRQLPHFSLPRLGGGRLSQQDFSGTAHLVNFFASWCVPCAAEHALLAKLAQKNGLPLLGIAQRDSVPALQRYLNKNGNPYAAIGLDSNAAASLEWGVTGVPETFLVDADNTIRAHSAGPMTESLWQRDFAPMLLKKNP